MLNTTNLTKELYEQQAAECDDLCLIDPGRIDRDDQTLMPCVTCPFCKQIVTALLTPATISCPACKVTVNR
ncbi:hypothetical protein BH10PAT3_BH10PAT3_6080 [soil metagenome]